MIKAYQVTDYHRIELREVEFERATEKCYFDKHGYRKNKRSENENYFPTKQEAEIFMRSIYDKRVLDAEREIADLQMFVKRTKEERDSFIRLLEDNK